MVGRAWVGCVQVVRWWHAEVLFAAIPSRLVEDAGLERQTYCEAIVRAPVRKRARTDERVQRFGLSST